MLSAPQKSVFNPYIPYKISKFLFLSSMTLRILPFKSSNKLKQSIEIIVYKVTQPYLRHHVLAACSPLYFLFESFNCCTIFSEYTQLLSVEK